MIQEPQRTEMIEIPVVDSMNAIEINSNKNSILKKNNIQNNIQSNIQNNLQNNIQNNLSKNKNRSTTLVQIPKQNSKPRIFLLTRPAKPQLVRKATQSVQHRHQSILSQTPIVASQAQSKIIRIPFLPRSQVQTFSVKSNQVNQPLRKDPIIVPLNRNTTIQASQLEIPKTKSILGQPEANRYPIITQQVHTKQLSSPRTEITNSKHQLQIPESVKSAIPTQKSTENKILQNPLTLTSMAGIELTGADMSLSDMSGAMLPTATVEEINVPVFIDEYLQEATTTTSVTTPNNIYNINNNNNNNNNISNNNNNNQSNGKGNEVNNCLDTFENFEFDIDLLTEATAEYDDEDNKELELLKQQQQQQLTEEVDDDDQQINLNIQQQQQHSIDIEKVKKQQQQKQQQQLQLQLMLEDILFNNNTNNIDNNNNGNNSCNNIMNNNNTTTTTSNNNNNMDNMAESNNFYDSLLNSDCPFNVAPSCMIDDMFIGDDKSLDVEINPFNSLDFSNTEDAIDINAMDNDNLLLNHCFINSQPPEIMFGAPPTLSQSQSAKLSQEINEAEPTISPDMMHYSDSSFNTAATPADETCNMMADIVSQLYEEQQQYTMEGKDSKTLLVNPLKRNGTQTNKHMEEKRLKLRLDTKRCRDTTDLPNELNTPNFINLCLNHEQESTDNIGPMYPSVDNIYQHLIENFPQSPAIKAEIIDDLTNEFSPPNTPYSVTSASNQTNFTGLMNTAPNSPASSIATTSNTSVNTNKRGRGRPAKTHSDIPDISQMQHLGENDRKKLLERAKNNEASRKSRLKHKERDNALETEENELRDRNFELDMELQKIRKIEMKLKNALRNQHFELKRHQ